MRWSRGGDRVEATEARRRPRPRPRPSRGGDRDRVESRRRRRPSRVEEEEDRGEARRRPTRGEAETDWESWKIRCILSFVMLLGKMDGFGECKNATSWPATFSGDIEEENLFAKGTTAIAFLTKAGITVLVDSRKSLEWIHKRTNTWKPDIKDQASKLEVLSKCMICILVGRSGDAYDMIEHVQTLMNSTLQKGKDVTVRAVSWMMKNHLSRLCGQKKEFGLLLVGYDKLHGFQIYRIFICDEVVVHEEAKEIATLGSGYGYANDILVHGYDVNLSNDEAKQLAIKAGVNAAVYDKNTGGTLHVYQVTINEHRPLRPCKALKAYYDNFEHYDSTRMLFMILAADEKTRLLSTDQFIGFFRLEADILVAHRVDERESLGSIFFFHRLIFTTQKEVQKVLNCPKVERCLPQAHHLPLFSYFTHQTTLDGGINVGKVPLKIGEASKQVLDFMLKNCPTKNAWKPNPQPAP